uniref:Uncharacterized protein n=1 Tax=Rhizophora mucronata TaxID=61149 RepID=A0A2P2PSG4_RHIMU
MVRLICCDTKMGSIYLHIPNVSAVSSHPRYLGN